MTKGQRKKHNRQRRIQLRHPMNPKQKAMIAHGIHFSPFVILKR